jgi:hypothetical protein
MEVTVESNQIQALAAAASCLHEKAPNIWALDGGYWHMTLHISHDLLTSCTFPQPPARGRGDPHTSCKTIGGLYKRWVF